VFINPLPADIAKARTQLIWLPEHDSVAQEALQKLLDSEQVRKAASTYAFDRLFLEDIRPSRMAALGLQQTHHS